MRLMTSLRTRTVSASMMLKRLSATTRQSGLAQALRQMGRIERILFTLDWINDEDLWKTTTEALNKGESRNSLVRAVNLPRLGRFRDRGQENLLIRASALNLVVTAIIHWNTDLHRPCGRCVANCWTDRPKAHALQSVAAYMGACEFDRRLSFGRQACRR